MNVKKIIAIILFIVGLGMIGGSLYIKNQVEQGKIKVANAERTIDQGKVLFSINPVSKQVGDGIVKAADRKIAGANRDIAYYENLAQQLMMGGILLIIVGVVVFAFSYRKRS